MSRWDSRLLWKYYDYHDFGIIGEPYFDVDFNEVFYLTDTGRRRDGDSVNIRDKAVSVTTFTTTFTALWWSKKVSAIKGRQASG